jgi:hypothetical protein
MIEAVRYMPVAGGLMTGTPACHIGVGGHLGSCRTGRQKLTRHAGKKSQRETERQETFQDRRHAGKMGL